MADNITYPTYEQLAVLLSRLANNYSVMADNFVTVFYDTNPQEVTFKMYDAEGNLRTYTIPNRAKDFNYIKNGEGNPEGRIAAPKGTLYQDTLNGNLYVKKILTGDATVGWFLIDSTVETFKIGPQNPEGTCDAALGTLYVNTTNFTLYVKTIDGGKEGWIPIVPAYDNVPIEGSTNGITSGAVYSALHAAVSDLQASIDIANNNIAGNTSDINSINSNLNTLNSDMTTVKGNIISINSDISDLQTLIGNINTALQEINGEGL